MEYRNCKHETLRELHLCPHCGALLGSGDIARRVRCKRSQLARVGLVGGLLEKRRRKKGHE